MPYSWQLQQVSLQSVRRRLVRWILKQPAGNARMQEIAAAIQAGARAYLNRQYSTIAIVGVILFFALGLAGLGHRRRLRGGRDSLGLAGYIGMFISVRANVRTAQAAHLGINAALKVAFRGGAITGMLVVGLGLLGVAGYFLGMLRLWAMPRRRCALVGLAFGGSLISIFARLGGGIFTKGADVGADLVGKVEAGIPEDDPRNPAVIADNVGDNVGDCAGMAADLFETYAVTLVATMLLGGLVMVDMGESAVLFPLVLGAISIVSSIIGTFFVSTKEGGKIMNALYKGVIVSAVISAIAFLFRVAVDHGPASHVDVAVHAGRPRAHRGDDRDHRVLHRDRIQAGAARGGGLADRPCDQHHCRPRRLDEGLRPAGDRRVLEHLGFLPARRAVRHRHRGHGDVVDDRHDRRARCLRPDHRQRRRHRRDGRAWIRRCAMSPILWTPWAIPPRPSPRAMPSARRDSRLWCCSPTTRTSSAKSLGHATAFDLSNPAVIIGLFIGGLIPYLFAAMAMEAVGRAAGAVVNEVRRQFREIPGIMEGTAKPDYSRAVDMLTKAAIKEMIVPSLLPILVPIVLVFVVNWLMGPAPACRRSAACSSAPSSPACSSRSR
jgi:Na+/H+-translocating membrane pyrophosphatase